MEVGWKLNAVAHTFKMKVNFFSLLFIVYDKRLEIRSKCDIQSQLQYL